MKESWESAPEVNQHPAQSLAERHREEVLAYDRLGQGQSVRGGYFYEWGLSSHSIAFAKSLLGPLRDKLVLDYGCGDGRESVEFAKQGAWVSSIEISARLADEAHERASRQGVGDRISIQQMAGEQMAFSDDTFDIVFGQSVLHHLDLELAHREILRVLKPGGKAVFIEPLMHNLILALFRRLTPWRRSKTEKPLTWKQVTGLGRGFAKRRHHEFYLLTLLAVFFPWEPLFVPIMNFLYQIDTWLLQLFPVFRKYCWITVIELVK